MYRLLSFLRRIYVPVIFLVAEAMALWFYSQSSLHSRARMLSLSDRLMGDVYGWIARGGSYFDLAETNMLLERRVQDLENELAVSRKLQSMAERDSLRAVAGFPHRYIVAHVVRNSVNKRENYLMLDRGSRDSVVRRMAVLSLAGEMVGYVENTSPRSAICVSVLNSQFRTSGMIKGTGHIGSISWPGDDPRMVQLTEVPKYAEIKRGDTILTGGSFNFPEGMLIGTVADYTTDETRASYNIEVRLAVDMAALHNVILVESPGVEDLIELERDILGES
jgi:rod shape-determining protein MreC